MNIGNSKTTAFLLNLILPGLGHFYWKEFIFGIFIFLIMLIAAILVVVSFFIEISVYGYILVLLLPAIFYVFTFIDLNKSIDKKKKIVKRDSKTALIYLLIGIIFQLLVPITPVNFWIRNAPEFFIVENNSMAPLYRKDDIIKSNSMPYFVNLFFYDKPILHHIPDRFDLIRFVDSNGEKTNGLVLGLPNEQVEIFDGVLAVNNYAINDDPPAGLFLSGYCELTTVSQYSILVATLNLGTVDKIYQVSLSELKGKIEKLF